MTTTNHIGITLVEQSQAQKEVTVNAALTRIDALLNTGAISRSANTPPGSPASGDLYIVGSSPTGAWSGQAYQITYYDQTWRFIAPREGLSFWVNDENMFYTYTGSSWALGDATITLTGDVTGSGMGTLATAIGAGKVTNTMLAGSIAASKLVGTDIATVGTVTAGTWNGSFGAVSGANLTSLTAANISAGTAGINISGNAATVTTNANLTGDVSKIRIVRSRT